MIKLIPMLRRRCLVLLLYIFWRVSSTPHVKCPIFTITRFSSGLIKSAGTRFNDILLCLIYNNAYMYIILL